MKIVNVKKFIRSIILILGIIWILTLMFGNKSLSHKDLEYKTICVSNGDTLWGLANQLQTSNSYYKGKDVRYIIDDIIEINNLDSKTLTVNQELQIPTV